LSKKGKQRNIRDKAMGVKVREKELKSGDLSLYLDIYDNGKRYKEYLGVKIIGKPRNPEERQHNKEMKRLANEIRANKEKELLSEDFDFIPQYKKNIDFVQYYKHFLDSYTNKDVRIVRYSYVWFVKLLKLKGITSIKPGQIDHKLCEEYLKFMQNGLNGETPYNYFTKFKRVVRLAIKDGLLKKDPLEGIKVIRAKGLKKEILSLDEIKQLSKTPCKNKEVKRAFIFSLYSGLRWVDVKDLTFGNIDFPNGRMKFDQSKTKHSSQNSQVVMDVTPTLLKLMGEPGLPDQKVFDLPTHTGALKMLKDWVEAAGINKNITWHCARHSFAVNLLTGANDIKTVASLLGHSGLKHMDTYSHAVDERKKKAMNSLPDIDFE
jgi:integrase/recombinase XerD